MKINKVVLRRMHLDFKKPFRTSFGLIQKDFSIIELYDEEGNVGRGACSAFLRPWYNEETTIGALYVIQNYLIPALFDMGDISTPEHFFDETAWIRRNRMARAAVDCALWELYSKELGVPEYKALGGVKNEIEAGVSLGIEETPDKLLHTIEEYMKQGYRRIKCKIKPGHDINYLSAVRREFGDIMLMADANSAYTLDDINLFREMDDLNLLMIEQPLESDDIVDHRHLQEVIKTPICLDESIISLDDARRAIELGSCKIINIKVARVGGLTEARRIQKYVGEHGVYCWCGGMVDDGVARGHNLAVATLPYYRYPNDIPSSDRYYGVDIVTPSTYIDSHAMVRLPELPGTGFELNQKVVDEHTLEKWEYNK